MDGTSPQSQPLCFVLMPFGPKRDPGGVPDIDFNRIYNDAIKPGIEAAGMYPVRAVVTLGSPLGLSAISQRLHPQPPAFPAAVRRWVNIAAPDDVVAARRELHAVFDRDRPHDALFEDTWNVDNGSKPHQINFYLTKKSCGAAVADALT